MSKEYTEGYKACLREFDAYLHNSMKRHGGCVTPGQAWDVMNDVAYFTHQQALRLHRAQQESTPVVFILGGM